LAKNPMPTVTHNGNTYKLRSRKIEIPNFDTMTELEALIWINRNTFPRGRQRAANPLIGLSGAITVKER
jgi:hypothetical protein